jgi:MFS family permease
VLTPQTRKDNKTNQDRYQPEVNAALPAVRTADDAVHETVLAPAQSVRTRVLALIVLATFGSGMALIVPMAYSLAVRLEQLQPGRPDILGYMLGVGAAVTLLVAPLTGVLSDRTRSRWGRRRPYTLAGLLVGAAAAPVMAMAPDPLWLTLGWVLSTVGWGTAAGSIGNYQADVLPPHQRGRVSGMTTVVMQVSPVLGILLVGLIHGDALPLFLLPAGIGAALVILFIAFAPEADSRGVVHLDRLSVRRILGSYVFQPRLMPDFAWNWLGRFIFFLGLTLTTSFSTLFFAQRLSVPVAEVVGFMALTSGLSIVTAMLGSLGVGWLSDRLDRRRLFIVFGVVLFAGGSVVSALAYDVAFLLTGSLISGFGVAVFIAVGQAVVLDVLPHRETQAGRYMAITGFSQKIPGVLAPSVAPLLLTVGTGTENYSVLYTVAAALALVGGLVIALKVRGVR